MPFTFGRSSTATLELPFTFEKEQVKVELDSNVLDDLITVFEKENSTTWFYTSTQRIFADFVQQHVSNPNSLLWCENCSAPVVEGADNTFTDDSNVYCEDCWNSFDRCVDCSVVCIGDYFDIGGDDVVCRSCYNNYSYCDDCDVYYLDGDAQDHEHKEDCDCESPAQTFTVPNNGNGLLSNDTRVDIGLPSGVIDEEGLKAIFTYLTTRYYDLVGSSVEEARPFIYARHTINSLDPKWQTKSGNYTKRLSKELHKTYKVKLPKEAISEIGNIARQHTNDSATYHVEITRNLNMSAEDFYHVDSCWWQSYFLSRCVLKSNGGFGIRSFDEYGDVTGRAWVMPLKKGKDSFLVPTFDANNADAFMVFNGYGDLSGYTAARIMSYMAGMTYRKVSFYVSDMYVNENNGYIITSEEIAEAASKLDYGVNIRTDAHASLYLQENKNV